MNAQYSNNIIGTLSVERKQRLESIGMVFTNQLEKSWDEMLKLVIVYFNNYGNLDIPVNFKTNDGITYDEKGKSLGYWLNRQKNNGIKGTISSEHRQKLENIGLKFELSYDKDWKNMYVLAKNYYDKYKNLNVPLDFKTSDGITYDEKGKNLYSWIYKQQCLYNTKSLSTERTIKLEQLGMNANNSH